MGEADERPAVERLLAVVEAQGAQIAAANAQIAALTSALMAALERQTAAAVPASTLTVAEGFRAYREAKSGEHSWESVDVKLKPIVRLAGDEMAMSLTPKRWRKHLAIRKTEFTTHGTHPADSTLREELSKTKSMLAWLADEEQGLIPFSPLARAKSTKGKGPKRSWLNEIQIQQLLAAREPVGAGPRLRLRAFVITKADTGLRFNEARKLRRDRLQPVGVDKWLAFIERTKNKKPHTIGLTGRAYEALMAIPDVMGSPFFFANPDIPTKALYHETSMRYWFNVAVSSAGLNATVAEGEKRHTPHGLRRSAATAAHNRGASLIDVQGMLNHSSPAITAQYVQPNASSALRIAELMETGAREERKLDKERRGPQRVPSADDGTGTSKSGTGR